jgi:quercetin dioxygenase-like cupin family protein
MRIVRPEDGERLGTPAGIDARKLLETPDAQVIHMTIDPGSGMKPHTTPVDVFFLVLEGTGSISAGGEEREVAAGSLVASPAGELHSWMNDSAEPLRLLIVKTPAPGSMASGR